ncbi:MAG: glutaredoxin [Dorea sp.]|jgi:glutaredoxin-related protein|nr:glutaredoxin [Dorea sp.]
MKILGTNLCIECRNAEERLKQSGLEYQYTDFTDSIDTLKEFIRFRDARKEFERAKADGKIGIPCFLFEDGTFTFDLEEAVARLKQS